MSRKETTQKGLSISEAVSAISSECPYLNAAELLEIILQHDYSDKLHSEFQNSELPKLTADYFLGFCCKRTAQWFLDKKLRAEYVLYMKEALKYFQRINYFDTASVFLCAHSIETILPYSVEARQEALEMYRAIAAQKKSMESFPANTRIAIIQGRNISEIVKRVEKILADCSGPNHQRSTPLVQKHYYWMLACNKTFGTKSTNPNIQALIDYLNQNIQQECINLETPTETLPFDPSQLQDVLENLHSAANAGHTLACNALRIYYREIGDTARESAYLHNPTTFPNKDVQYELYSNHEHYLSRSFAHQDSGVHLTIAASYGHPEAQFILYQQDKASFQKSGFARDLRQAKYRLKIAAQNNSTKAQYETALLHKSGELQFEVDEEKYFYWLKKAACNAQATEDAVSRYAQELTAIAEILPTPDLEASKVALLQARHKHNDDAKLKLAYCYEHGFACSTNLAEAEKLYDELPDNDNAKFRSFCFKIFKQKSKKEILALLRNIDLRKVNDDFAVILPEHLSAVNNFVRTSIDVSAENIAMVERLSSQVCAAKSKIIVYCINAANQASLMLAVAHLKSVERSTNFSVEEKFTIICDALQALKTIRKIKAIEIKEVAERASEIAKALVAQIALNDDKDEQSLPTKIKAREYLADLFLETGDAQQKSYALLILFDTLRLTDGRNAPQITSRIRELINNANILSEDLTIEELEQFAHWSTTENAETQFRMAQRLKEIAKTKAPADQEIITIKAAYLVASSAKLGCVAAEVEVALQYLAQEKYGEALQCFLQIKDKTVIASNAKNIKTAILADYSILQELSLAEIAKLRALASNFEAQELYLIAKEFEKTANAKNVVEIKAECAFYLKLAADMHLEQAQLDYAIVAATIDEKLHYCNLAANSKEEAIRSNAIAILEDIVSTSTLEKLTPSKDNAGKLLRHARSLKPSAQMVILVNSSPYIKKSKDSAAKAQKHSQKSVSALEQDFAILLEELSSLDVALLAHDSALQLNLAKLFLEHDKIDVAIKLCEAIALCDEVVIAAEAQYMLAKHYLATDANLEKSFAFFRMSVQNHNKQALADATKFITPDLVEDLQPEEDIAAYQKRMLDKFSFALHSQTEVLPADIAREIADRFYIAAKKLRCKIVDEDSRNAAAKQLAILKIASSYQDLHGAKKQTQKKAQSRKEKSATDKDVEYIAALIFEIERNLAQFDGQEEIVTAAGPNTKASPPFEPPAPTPTPTTTAIAEPTLEEIWLKRDKDEMDKFLSRREINITSITDLPPFLRRRLQKLLKQNYEVALKGSITCIGAIARGRKPSDLDIEVCMPNLSKLSDEEIRQFILEKFEVEYKDPIFRKGFVSVNFTDSERKLDISIYDSNNLPPEHLSWTCNKDERIEFDKDGKARLMPARGLDRYIKEAKISDAAAPLIINPSARKLFLRLCFLEAIEEITRENIAAALDAIPHQTHPYILLQDELANKDGIFTQESVLAKMQDFVESHDLNQVEKARFCRAMQNIIDLGERDPDSEALRKSLSGIVTAITGALQIISGTTTPITTKQLSVESAAQLSTAPEVSLLK